MGDICPTCKRPLPAADNTISNEADLIKALRRDGGQEVYRSANNTWHITRRRHGEVSADLVASLVRQGVLHSVYDTCASDAYHLGRTMSAEATRLHRARTGRKHEIVCTDGTITTSAGLSRSHTGDKKQ